MSKAEQQPTTRVFNLDALRLPQNFAESFGVKRLITRVPVRKPPKGVFFRAHPDPKWRFPTAILELKEEQETYLLEPGVREVVSELTRPVVLHAAVDRQGNPFLIPVPLPGDDGRRNPWHESLAQAVGHAEQKWIRCTANMHSGAYDIYVAEGALPEPEWPSIDFEDLVETAFRGRIIDSDSHPVISKLLGRS